MNGVNLRRIADFALPQIRLAGLPSHRNGNDFHPAPANRFQSRN